jgi:isopentenyl diphosphate isomerase/L-lactate dehydrogenase-like FMN-dependent dehydrogenase
MTSQSAPSSALTQIPAEVRCAADYARLAGSFMVPALFAHVDGGSGHDHAARANLAAFAELAIVPRVLRRVGEGHTRATLGGVERPHPIMLAPLGAQAPIHPQAERASAMGAAATQACFVASTMASTTLEGIAAVAGPDRWFQLYIQPERAATLDLVRRAEAAGYTAIVVTVDAPIQLPSFRAVAAGYQPPGDAPNLGGYPLRQPVALAKDASQILNGFMRDAPTFADIAWLRAETALPLWIKGVMHQDDARELVARGADGVIVSNHGGRTLDGAPSSLSRLAAIRAAVGEAVPVLFDGGIRSGGDVFKAIALGADAVLVGRLQAYALAVAGALGVAHMIKLLREELEACMALAGCATLADIRSAELAPGRLQA